MIILGADFMGVMLLLVYVGAVVVSFLFVVMPINVRMVERSRNKLSYVPLGVVLGTILGIELMRPLVLLRGEPSYQEWASNVLSSSLIESVGLELYTIHQDSVFSCGIILLVGIIGSLVITRK
jgi:NADH-quinone oxidoreductase subunit J